MNDSNKAVFLSYASQDAEAAWRICDALRAAGIEVWFDQSELRGGDVWDRQIRKQIHDCALFVPIISANTQARPEGYFRLEWKLAVERTHLMSERVAFLVPLVIDDTRDAEADVPDKFREVQWMRLPKGEASPDFVERVSRLLSPDHHVSPPPSRLQVNRAPGIVAASHKATRHSGIFRRSRPALLVTAAAVVIAVGYLAVDRFVLSKRGTDAGRTTPTAQPVASAPSKIREKSIAVLPFVDMSEKKDQEYFSDGLSEELIDHLAHAADLKVIARTSSFQFKGKNEDARTIAAKLGVANLLEGSVRTAGHAVRITAQLIRASDGTHLWSQTYDRKMSDIFKVQDEIASTVVEALKATLTGGPSDSAGREPNVEAYNLLLKGNFFYERSHPGDYDRAVDQFKQALALDPNYALAWAKLARVYIWQGIRSEFSVSEAESKARDALQRALSIDPNLSVAHRWLARLYMNYRSDWTAAKSEFERAIALDPNGPEGQSAHVDLLVMTALNTGRFEDVIQYVSEDLARNPLDTRDLYFLGWILFYSGHLQEAAAMQHRLLELDPAFLGAHAGAASTWLLMGKNADALAEAEKEPDEESRLLNLALVYWAMGRRTDADMALHQLESKFAKVAAYRIGAVHAYRGEADAAITWLERAYRQRDVYIEFLKVDPLLRNLRGDPRYKALLSKTNLAE